MTAPLIDPTRLDLAAERDAGHDAEHVPGLEVREAGEEHEDHRQRDAERERLDRIADRPPGLEGESSVRPLAPDPDRVP